MYFSYDFLDKIRFSNKSYGLNLKTDFFMNFFLCNWEAIIKNQPFWDHAGGYVTGVEHV